MQYIPSNSALLAQETVFLPKVFQKLRELRQILISQRNRVGSGEKFSSESKLFGEGLSCLSTTSATLSLIIEA